ncbi:MAG: sulfatase-like hydrolase/transferase, partial [bacterium]|nr:sulfatase-like hydrolase/transferase [bacterium]
MDAPNVVMIVLDDLGFAQLGCYGAEISTPNIDLLAEDGLRYNSFHVTSLCGPTRATLITGRNHHAVGMGIGPEVPMGFPGYTGRIPKSAATLPRLLRDSGYSALAVGKWHLTPRFERNQAGP